MNKSQYGIGLLELMLSLALISILTLSALHYYHSVRLSQRVGATVDLVQSVLAAVEQRLVVPHGLDQVSVPFLIKRQLMPAALAKNAWGGDVVVSKGEVGVTVRLIGLPIQACRQIQSKLERLTTSASVCIVTGEAAVYQAGFFGHCSRSFTC